MNYPQLKMNPTGADCVAWIRRLTSWVGAGFHPDTPAADYVAKDESGFTRQSFSPEICDLFDADLDRCYAILNARGKDTCEIAIKVQRRMLRPLATA